MGASAGVSAMGAYNQSAAAKSAYNAQAQVQRNNAQLAEWQAQDAEYRGERTVAQVGLRARMTKGTQRAQLAANGVDLGQGSALQILSDTDQFARVDMDTAIDNKNHEVWAIRQQATGFTNEAGLMQSRSDAESPAYAATASLFGSAGRVAGNWYASTARKPVDVPYG